MSAHEITTDGRTVWVNAPNCVGRFCPFSAEVARKDETILKSGPNHRTGTDEWAWFVRMMSENYGIKVPKKYRPPYIK